MQTSYSIDKQVTVYSFINEVIFPNDNIILF